MNILLNIALTILFTALTFSCTPKTDTMDGALTHFPSCFEGQIDGLQGDTYSNHIRVDFNSNSVYLRIDSLSIPSFAEQRTHCNIIKYPPELPNSQESGLLNMWANYDNRPVNEPSNPCRNINYPMFTLIGHDWVGPNNQEDTYNTYWDPIYLSEVFLVYSIDNNETRTAWSGVSTKGWDGIIKANFSHVILFNSSGNPITNKAIYERKLIEAYIEAVIKGHISDQDKRAIANFSRIFHYLKTLRLYLQFYQPGPISGQPQVLKGDYSIEAKVRHDTYRPSNGWYNPKIFKSTISRAHPPYDTATYNEGSWNEYYPDDFANQVPAIRGTTQGLLRCSQ